jgi:(E)-4-hydroxy-3-methylbut-2-enyl-diphosphate synthase
MRRIVQIGQQFIGGGKAPAIQSMTNTDTADIVATSQQIVELAAAGSQFVRITVNNEAAAKAVPEIVKRVRAQGHNTPIIGDFHYNGHILLQDNELATSLDKYRINPGNVGFGAKRDTQFSTIIKVARDNNKPVRIGANWGSLDSEMLARLMDRYASEKSSDEITRMAMIESALQSAEAAEELGLPADKIVISCKVSSISELVPIYQELAKRCDYALHLGLTEAGMGIKGIVSSAAALGILLNQGIGDTIRVSLTPKPEQSRCDEVEVAKEILQSLGIVQFAPSVTACPGCGRTTSTFFQKLSLDTEEFIKRRMPVWTKQYKGVESLKLAVMGCIVNGPGESKHSDIGISLPGTGESPKSVVFIDGEKYATIDGDITSKYHAIIEEYVSKKYAKT